MPELSELGIDVRLRCTVFPPDSEQSQTFCAGIIHASTYGNIEKQVGRKKALDDDFLCPLYSTAELKYAGYGDPPEWRKKRERILFSELMEEIPQLEETTEEQDEWIKQRMSSSNWKRSDGMTEEWQPFSMIDGEPINIWRYYDKND